MAMTSTRTPVPVSFFSIPVGLLAFAGTWHGAARLWHLTDGVAQAFALAGLAVWAGLLVLYARKWLTHRVAAVTSCGTRCNRRSRRWCRSPACWRRWR